MSASLRPLSQRRATIIDVAARAGVSKSLASRALRDEPGVSAENRARVKQAATECGYRLNSAARSLVRGRSGLLGVVLNEIENQHHTTVVGGVEAYAEQHDLGVLLAHGGGDPARLTSQINTMLELRVDGLVIVSAWVPRSELKRMGGELPTVVVSRLQDPPSVIDTICSDDVVGSRLAVAHLLDSGRRSIGYLTRSQSPTSKARVEGLLDATRAAGIEGRIFEVPRQGSAEIAAVLTGRSCDALLCNNDQTAAETLRLAREIGIDVPEELALVGYDNTPLSELVSPALSSVDQPQRLMGLRAAEAIAQRLAGRTEPLREFHEPTLVIRDSSGYSS